MTPARWRTSWSGPRPRTPAGATIHRSASGVALTAAVVEAVAPGTRDAGILRAMDRAAVDAAAAQALSALLVDPPETPYPTRRRRRCPIAPTMT